MIHFNQEYLTGFIEGLLAEYDLNTWSFKKFLDYWVIDVKLNSEDDELTPTIIKIRYGIKSSDCSYITDIYLSREHSTCDFCALVQQAVKKTVLYINKEYEKHSTNNSGI